MTGNRLDALPHRRRNPLTGDWILVSPHRTERPWSGQEDQPDTTTAPKYDPECYLCPGNRRAQGTTNPDYSGTFVFTNDYSALLPGDHAEKLNDDYLLQAEAETGICRVVCYTPRHDLTIARMDSRQIEQVVSTWITEYLDLESREHINYVQVFENRGLMMGCSNPHPHGQIWANRTVPTLPATEGYHQKIYFQEKKCCLLCSYLELELTEKSRIISANASFVALVPFWATWPYETMILPRRHISSITKLSSTEQKDLATIMKALGVCYDNLFQTSFPYSMGIHQQPTDNLSHEYWHLHLHYFPPLLRSQSVKKHMVGYEMLAMPQRDLTPEMAADRLRAQSSTHYMDGDPGK